MALVKMTRELPEVPGGKTEGQFPEEAIEVLKRAGWKVVEASVKSESKPVSKPEVKEAKAEESKVESKVEKKEEKVEKSKK